ncbi:Hypothetical_protein [Hexamita inflata]|uniref:Hypothetical_protein n=1 Tax=Hexamita inflata TaxID=28002 RepID=A0AA86V0S5_9EUKA|nr:Hypothetical protein HINF_LOCUS59432 [Hexamita inflata]
MSRIEISQISLTLLIYSCQGWVVQIFCKIGSQTANLRQIVNSSALTQSWSFECHRFVQTSQMLDSLNYTLQAKAYSKSNYFLEHSKQLHRGNKFEVASLYFWAVRLISNIQAKRNLLKPTVTRSDSSQSAKCICGDIHCCDFWLRLPFSWWFSLTHVVPCMFRGVHFALEKYLEFVTVCKKFTFKFSNFLGL